MKKHVVLGLALMFSLFSFAQKKELKVAEKAIKSSNFADAKSALQSAEALISAMDEKTKAKFYFLKGQALYANGSGNDSDIAEALNSFKTLIDIEEKSGKMTYTTKANDIKLAMSNAFIKKASDAYEKKNYAVSAVNFERAYRVSTVDTLYLYNSASVAVLGKDYDTALKLYDELMEVGYTGITTEYFATNVETGEEQSFPNSSLRDISIKAGTHEKSRNVKTESKAGEIAKNIALIYIELGDNDKAIEAIEKAKLSSPNDFNLLVSEANIRYKIGDKDKYKELIAEALAINPNNVDLLFNLGVVAADEDDFETAKKYYNMAIETDPTYTKAKMNMAALILDQEQGIIEEMNGLGSSAADDRRYDELKDNRQQLYKDAIPYLAAILDVEPDNLSAAKTLMNIYSAIDDMPNYKAMKAKVSELENQN
ncbi:MAG: tetratricopeptide repeat protein [Flavobacteriaceae bacterium]|nr:tetratricopeptide repeat protein [Flavobacteriaceae bacterium]